MLFASTIKTPIGELSVISNENILVATGFAGVNKLLTQINLEVEKKNLVKHLKSDLIIKNLSDYFAGDLDALNGIQVAQHGGEFCQKAWKAMRKINPGKTISYAQLASKAGSPRAVRAAGSACASNLIAVVVPCHRIVKSDGSLGNYAFGIRRKEWLLEHEGASQ